jgi:hypothetical protein
MIVAGMNCAMSGYKGQIMTTYKISLVCSHWYEKTIEADSPEEAEAIAWGDTLTLNEWKYEGEGEAETHEIIAIEPTQGAK